MSTQPGHEAGLEDKRAFVTLYDECRITVEIPDALPFTIEKGQQRIYFDRNQINALLAQIQEASDWFDAHE